METCSIGTKKRIVKAINKAIETKKTIVFSVFNDSIEYKYYGKQSFSNEIYFSRNGFMYTKRAIFIRLLRYEVILKITVY